METWITIAVVAVAVAVGLFRLLRDRRQEPLQKSYRQGSVPSVFSQAQQTSRQTAERDAAQTRRPHMAAVESVSGSVGDSAPPRPEMVSATANRMTADSSPIPPAVAARTSHRLPPTAASTWSESDRTGRRLFHRFDGILQQDSRQRMPIQPEELPMTEDQMVFGTLTPALAELLPESQQRRQQQRQQLTAAGFLSRAAWINLNAIRLTLMFMSVVVVLIWLIMAPPALEPALMAALVTLPLLGWAVPPLWVSSRAAERRFEIERGLPDILDMLNMGVSQGLTVSAALRRVALEIAPANPALAVELQVVNRQAELSSLSQALKNFSRRIDSPEVNAFTALLIQSEATGTSITRALNEYSDSMRSSLRERADSRANSASFKLLFPVALCLMPSVFLFLLGPAIVDVNEFFSNTADQLLDDRSSALDSLDLQPISRQ